MKQNEFQKESVQHNQYDLLFTDWTRLGLKLFYKLSNMLYGGNALSDLLDNVFIVEAGKSAPGYLWRCLPLDLDRNTSSLDLIDVLQFDFKTHWVFVTEPWDRTTVGGCCKSLSSGDYNYVTGFNYITNIRTDTFNNHHQHQNIFQRNHSSIRVENGDWAHLVNW